MSDLEKNFDQALLMLKKGHSKQEVLVKFASEKNELAPLLNISESLFKLPKNIVPTPLMRRKYASIPVKHFWLAWFHVSKFAGISASLVLLLSVIGVTGYAASDSKPGNALFAIKKSAEKVEVLLAYNQNQKASLQVAIANQRLSDAQKVFSDPQSNDQQKTAALNELADQTSSAVATVKTVATANPKSQDNNPLLNSLDSLASQQQSLLTAIKPDGQTQSATQSAIVALSQSANQISQIKQSVSVADSDQTPATLSANADSVTILGQITKITASQITVEKTDFALTTQTSIVDGDGKQIDAGQLVVDEKVNVIGIKNKNSLVAKQVLVTNASSTPNGVSEVKSDSTQSTSTISSMTTSSSTAQTQGLTGKKVDSTTTTDTTATTTPVDPNTATGSFIYETPAPQFVQ